MYVPPLRYKTVPGGIVLPRPMAARNWALLATLVLRAWACMVRPISARMERNDLSAFISSIVNDNHAVIVGSDDEIPIRQIPLGAYRGFQNLFCGRGDGV